MLTSLIIVETFKGGLKMGRFCWNLKEIMTIFCAKFVMLKIIR